MPRSAPMKAVLYINFVSKDLTCFLIAIKLHSKIIAIYLQIIIDLLFILVLNNCFKILIKFLIEITKEIFCFKNQSLFTV